MAEIAATMAANLQLKSVVVSVGCKGASRRLSNRRIQKILTIFGELDLDPRRYEIVLDNRLTARQLRIDVAR